MQTKVCSIKYSPPMYTLSTLNALTRPNHMKKKMLNIYYFSSEMSGCFMFICKYFAKGKILQYFMIVFYLQNNCVNLINNRNLLSSAICTGRQRWQASEIMVKHNYLLNGCWKNKTSKTINYIHTLQTIQYTRTTHTIHTRTRTHCGHCL